MVGSPRPGTVNGWCASSWRTSPCSTTTRAASPSGAGGATQTLHVPRRQAAWQLRQTAQPGRDPIARLLDDATEDAVARQLKAQGVLSGTRQPCMARIVARLRRTYGLTSRDERLRERGFLTAANLAQDLQVCVNTVHVWRRAGRLHAQSSMDKGAYLYAPL